MVHREFTYCTNIIIINNNNNIINTDSRRSINSQMALSDINIDSFSNTHTSTDSVTLTHTGHTHAHPCEWMWSVDHSVNKYEMIETLSQTLSSSPSPSSSSSSAAAAAAATVITHHSKMLLTPSFTRHYFHRLLSICPSVSVPFSVSAVVILHM